MAKRALKIAVASIAVIAVLIGGLSAFILWEGSSARETAPVLETNVAQCLLHYTVPASSRAMKNPLNVKAVSADGSSFVGLESVLLVDALVLHLLW